MSSRRRRVVNIKTPSRPTREHQQPVLRPERRSVAKNGFPGVMMSFFVAMTNCCPFTKGENHKVKRHPEGSPNEFDSRAKVMR